MRRLGGLDLFTRATGCVIVPLWLASMCWLVAHDMWPGLSAQDPPTLQVTDWLKNEGSRVQFAIQDDDGHLGTVWSEYRIEEEVIQRNDLIWIERFPLGTAPMRMHVDSSFTADGLLDEITVTIRNVDVRMRLHGERFHRSFSFTFEAGLFETAFKLPLSEAGFISAGFNPFGQLADMKVGDRWRMQVFNPVAALTNIGDKFIPILVEVTGKESLVVAGETKECLVVESPNAKAWVDEHGAVQVQELSLPGFGKLRLVRASGFDNGARTRARRHVFGESFQRGVSWNP